MIGTQENAAIASTLGEYIWTGETLPEGWTFLGEGCYRYAFLSPEGCVYKVSHYSEEDTYTENETEWRNFVGMNDAIVKHSNGKCRLAESSYFATYDVIAMEYVPMAKPAMKADDKGFSSNYINGAEDIYVSFTRVGLFDQGESNIWFDENGILVMIDYAA